MILCTAPLVESSRTMPPFKTCGELGNVLIVSFSRGSVLGSWAHPRSQSFARTFRRGNVIPDFNPSIPGLQGAASTGSDLRLMGTEPLGFQPCRIYNVAGNQFSFDRVCALL